MKVTCLNETKMLNFTYVKVIRWLSSSERSEERIETSNFK